MVSQRTVQYQSTRNVRMDAQALLCKSVANNAVSTVCVESGTTLSMLNTCLPLFYQNHVQLSAKLKRPGQHSDCSEKVPVVSCSLLCLAGLQTASVKGIRSLFDGAVAMLVERLKRRDKLRWLLPACLRAGIDQPSRLEICRPRGTSRKGS